jgi:SAM-dependent methyltransferase
MVSGCVSERVKNCLLCGSGDSREFYAGILRAGKNREVEVGVVKCCQCGLVYTNPRPRPDAIDQINISIHDRRDLSDFYRVHLGDLEFNTKRARKWLEEIEGYKQGGLLLDVGCATGTFLVEARRRGWRVAGVEACERTALFARNELKLNVFPGKLGQDVFFSPSYFDVITMWDVLEHLQDPFSTLRCVKEVLRDDGLLVVQTPNIESFLSRLLKAKWEGLCLPLHLYHFSVDTLKALLDRAGFRPIRIETWEPHTAVLKLYLDGKERGEVGINLKPGPNDGGWIVAISEKGKGE